MKKLVIVRHAKAEEVSEITGNDFERKLTKKGKSDALVISLNLKETYHSTPDLIISSPAKRAMKTAKIFAETFDYPASNILYESFLYDYFGTDDIKTLLTEKANQFETVFLFGHNPTVSMLISQLNKDFSNVLPKAGVAVMTFEVDYWTDISHQNCSDIYFLHPNEFL